MANICRTKTVTVAVGNTYNTTPGARSIDFLYYGTTDAVTITGSYDPSTAIPIPPNVPYTLEYNERGYDEVLVTNGGDAAVYIVEKF